MPIIYQFNSSNRTESKKMPSTPSPSPSSYCSEPVFIEKDGQTIPYIPIEIKNGRDAYAASLHMLFNHFAQFHISVVDIISDKYNIPVEEIMNTIKTDDRYTSMSVCPNIHELSKATSSSSSSVASVDVPVETATVVDSKKKVIKKIKINTDKKIKIKPKINSTNTDIVSNDNL
jgi:hypothetical protein